MEESYKWYGDEDDDYEDLDMDDLDSDEEAF